MAHCGYEPTAVDEAISRPLTNIWRTFRGPRTKGPMAPEPAPAPARLPPQGAPHPAE
jgi:hypothetical protein